MKMNDGPDMFVDRVVCRGSSAWTSETLHDTEKLCPLFVIKCFKKYFPSALSEFNSLATRKVPRVLRASSFSTCCQHLELNLYSSFIIWNKVQHHFPTKEPARCLSLYQSQRGSSCLGIATWFLIVTTMLVSLQPCPRPGSSPRCTN